MTRRRSSFSNSGQQLRIPDNFDGQFCCCFTHARVDADDGSSFKSRNFFIPKNDASRWEMIHFFSLRSSRSFQSFGFVVQEDLLQIPDIFFCLFFSSQGCCCCCCCCYCCCSSAPATPQDCQLARFLASFLTSFAKTGKFFLESAARNFEFSWPSLPYPFFNKT